MMATYSVHKITNGRETCTNVISVTGTVTGLQVYFQDAQPEVWPISVGISIAAMRGTLEGVPEDRAALAGQSDDERPKGMDLFDERTRTYAKEMGIPSVSATDGNCQQFTGNGEAQDRGRGCY
jgi:hypothetical protein